MVVNDRPLKRTKRRVTSDFYDFLTFLNAEFSSTHPDSQPQPFRELVQTFLSRHARATFPPSLFSPLTTWQILFRVGDLFLEGSDSAPVVVALDIIEEDVTRSRSVYCDQCRVVGWSGHPVCRKRYHFIIRSPSNPVDGGYQKSCSMCGNLLRLSESRCKWCDSEITSEEVEDWANSHFEDNTHVLHGVVHSNGYGHLLTLNGREGGSKFLSGFDVMNFWDRLCTALSVRKVSVMDVSKKYGTEYRLLHAIAEGHSWYGKWGYEFGAGSYALTLDAYQMSVINLASTPLATLMHLGRKPRTRVQSLIALYQSLAEKELLTLKDLFSFLLSLIHRSHKTLPHKSSQKFEWGAPNVLCAWTRDDVECVQQAMIKVLLASAGADCWVARRLLKGAVCKVATPELIDYSLKHLAGKVASGGMVIQTRCNPNLFDLEFRLEPVSLIHGSFYSCEKEPTEKQIIGHLKFLYESIVHPKTMVDYRPLALREHIFDSASKILDCKQFMKVYKIEENENALETSSGDICLWCHVELLDQPKDDLVIPPELIILPLNATVADLKYEAAKTFSELYPMFKSLDIDDLLEYGSIEDTITARLLVGSSGSIQVKGKCDVKHGLNRYRMERGMESWIVDCLCGAKDDDGERMLACDVCSVWQHTRCSGIGSFDAIPSKFICKRCDNSDNSYSSETNVDKENFDISVSGTGCRNEVMASSGSKTASKLTMQIDVR